jgi:eukaryotic-like serine/threonine-protein kinase
MTPNDSSAPRGAEIIAPIRVRTSSAEGQPAGRRHPRRMGMAAALLLIAALTAGGVWWIGHLSRHPLETPPAASPALAPPALPSPPLTGAQASSEPQQPSPPSLPAATAPPGPAAPQNTGQAEAVKQRLASAEGLAAAGNLSAALSDFQEALRLNPQSQPAREGLQRVKSRMTAEEFRRWMAEGFAALNAGDLTHAQSRFLKAKALRPEAPEVAEALAQTENRLRTARIETARQKALAADQREDWAGALAAYEEALEIEPTLQFAQQGKERVAALVTLERRIAFFVNQPEVLDSDAQLENAVRLLQELSGAPPLGSRLRAAADKLGALVQTAKSPVRVAVESDSLTDVSVYRVGRIGRFSVRELSLRPGTYIVVGSRDGFRDERLELVVKPGPEPIRVTIVCKVKV